MKPLIELKGVTKIYQTGLANGPTSRATVMALSRINLQLWPGESIGITGPNGSGKTTLLRAIGGTLNLTHGEVVRRAVPRMIIGLGSSFIEQLSGRENVFLYGSLLGRRQAELRQNLAEIIDVSELKKVIDEPLRDYSQGMRARLAFAVAISCQPHLVCIDEVINVGDQKFQEKSRQLIKTLADSGTTFVITSHNQGLLELLTQRQITMENGRIV